MVFNEEGEWDCGAHKKEYNFFPEFEEQTSREVQQVPRSPISPTFEDTSSERITMRTQRLEDLYEETWETNNITLFCLFADFEPINFEEATQDKKWRDVMDEEIRSIEKKNTWELVSLPNVNKSIGVKWVYKARNNAKGEIERYKARLVTKGYS